MLDTVGQSGLEKIKVASDSHAKPLKREDSINLGSGPFNGEDNGACRKDIHR